MIGSVSSMWSGILERHPGLKVVMTECSAGWLGWLINFLDHHYFGRFGNDFLTTQGFQPMKATEAPPGYYIKRQIACTYGQVIAARMSVPPDDDRVEVMATAIASVMWLACFSAGSVPTTNDSWQPSSKTASPCSVR